VLARLGKAPLAPVVKLRIPPFTIKISPGFLPADGRLHHANFKARRTAASNPICPAALKIRPALCWQLPLGKPQRCSRRLNHMFVVSLAMIPPSGAFSLACPSDVAPGAMFRGVRLLGLFRVLTARISLRCAPMCIPWSPRRSPVVLAAFWASFELPGPGGYLHVALFRPAIFWVFVSSF